MLGAALLILNLVSTAYSLPSREAKRHSVVVVGAGVAGVSATATFLENHIDDIILLEASDRVGGRIHTVQYGDIAVDKGAEFVHGEVDNAVYELVSPYNMLVSYKKSMLEAENFLYISPSGEDLNSSFVHSLIMRAYDVLYFNHAMDPNVSVADYFNTRLDAMFQSEAVNPQLGEAVRHLAHLMHLTYNAPDNLTDLGMSSYSTYEENKGDLSLTWKSGGYKIIFDFLTKKFPNPAEELPVLNKTVFGKQVTLISLREGEGEGVEARCADGSIYLAQHVIFTPSLGVLKKHAHSMFRPPLPANKTAAIQALGFGSVGKVFILFPSRWWPKNVTVMAPLFSQHELEDFKKNSVHGSWSAYSSGFYPVISQERMLCLWFTGPACRAMEALSEDQVLDGVLELLKYTLGKKFDIPRPDSVLKSSWASNPLTLGSYSYRSVTSDHLQVNNTALAAPVMDSNGKPVILFAGEATHPHYYSTVHGALETGRREARNVINYLNHSSS